MKRFFEHIAQGKQAPNALAQSQREFLHKLRGSSEFEPWLHPYFWSVYNITGDDRVHFAK
jgi:CHAT domain-containing protein